jgi:hypothetical protein
MLLDGQVVGVWHGDDIPAALQAFIDAGRVALEPIDPEPASPAPSLAYVDLIRACDYKGPQVTEGCRCTHTCHRYSRGVTYGDCIACVRGMPPG